MPSSTHGKHSVERQGGVSEDRYLSVLMELRKRWKLRRSASGITVDVSFASGVCVGGWVGVDVGGCGCEHLAVVTGFICIYYCDLNDMANSSL